MFLIFYLFSQTINVNCKSMFIYKLPVAVPQTIQKQGICKQLTSVLYQDAKQFEFCGRYHTIFFLFCYLHLSKVYR